MDNLTIDHVKEELIKESSSFRELVNKHQSYEKRLSELTTLTFPSEEEQLEETTIKKKKLAIKDEIYSMIMDYSKTHNIGH